MIVTASDDGTARLWPSLKDLLQLAESLIQREPPISTPEERRRFGLEQGAEHDVFLSTTAPTNPRCKASPTTQPLQEVIEQ